MLAQLIIGCYDQKTASRKVAEYVDFDHAGDLNNRRSMTGYAFSFGGGLISWKSVLQSTVALSTTEAECMATTNATKEAAWLKGLVEELSFKQDAIQLQCDSQSAIFFTKNQVFHASSKHIAI